MKKAQRPFLFVLVLLSLLAAFPAAGWEYAYGPTGTADEGFRRVIPSTACPNEGRGYVAVGTLDQFSGAPDVYAVYTDPFGARVWEFGYDVQGLGFADEGIAVAELPGTGFAIVSNSDRGGVWQIALTRIRCDGTVIDSRIYYDRFSQTGLRAHDMIRTVNGDLAIAGQWERGATNDAYLLRVDAAGFLVWDAAYETGGDEIFYALTEVVDPFGSVLPDLVAVGRFDKGSGDLQGLVARVDGGTGNIGFAPQCIAQHGNDGTHEVYHSVALLTNPAYAGQLAMTGVTSGGGWLDDIWMTRGNPCVLAAQSRIGNPVGGATVEQGNDLREIQGPILGPAGGSLAVVGSYRPVLGFTDATYLQVASGTLMPLGGTGRTFGGPADEHFFSLAEDPAGWGTGFVLAGTTETSWTPGDPSDLYLAHYDPNALRRGCEQGWSPAGIALGWPQHALQWWRQDPTRSLTVTTPAVKYVTAQQICR